MAIPCTRLLFTGAALAAMLSACDGSSPPMNDAGSLADAGAGLDAGSGTGVDAGAPADGGGGAEDLAALCGLPVTLTLIDVGAYGLAAYFNYLPAFGSSMAQCDVRADHEFDSGIPTLRFSRIETGTVAWVSTNYTLESPATTDSPVPVPAGVEQHFRMSSSDGTLEIVFTLTDDMVTVHSATFTPAG